MCYILDSAIDHMNMLEKMEVELETCSICQDHVHDSLCIKNPMDDSTVCKWCCDDHSLIKDIIKNAEPEDVDEYIDTMIRDYKKKFKPKNK
jgi:hypothetical protein